MLRLKLLKSKSVVKFLYFLLFVCICHPANNIFAQEEPDDMKLLRQAWFETQRFYPYDTMQSTNLSNELDFQQNERENNEYYFGPNLAVWSSIGPTPYYQGNIPHTGRVMTVKYNPSNANIVYIAGHNGGLWKTTNGQANWQNVVFTPKTDNFQTQSSGSIVIAPNNNNIMYYATGGGMYFAINYPGVGIYKSTDAGESWTGPYKIYLNGTPVLTKSFKLSVHPHNPNFVYLAEATGLWMSVNGGINWTRALPTSGTVPKQCCDVEISDRGWDFDSWIYAVGPRPDWQPAWWTGNEYNGIGYWVSTNNGANFFQPQNCGFTPIDRSHIAVSKTNPNKVYALTIQGNVKVYRSTNGGLNFTDEVVLIDRPSMANSMVFLEVSPINPNVAWVGFGDAYTCRHGIDQKYHLFRTTNGGLNYEPICSPYADQTNFDFHPTDPNQIMLSNDGGVWRCNNAMGPANQIAFESLSKTLSFSLTFRVTSNPYNPQDIFIAQTDNGYLQKDYNQLTWTSRMSCCDGTNVLYSRNIQGLILGSTGVSSDGFNYTLWNSTNNGLSFTNHYVPGFADGDVEWIRPIVEHPSIAGTFYTIRRNQSENNKINLLISTDRGNNWQVVSNTSPIVTANSDNVPQLLTIQENNTQIMYVATNSRIAPSEIYKTMDGGGNWDNLFIHNNGIPDRFVTSIITDPCNQSISYVSLSGYGTEHIYKSTNGGLTWFQISNPNGVYQTPTALPSIPVNYLMIRYISRTQKQLIAATDAGVYQSVDDGSKSWKELASGLPNTIATSLNHNLLAGKLLVSTWGRGVYQTNLPGQIYVPCRQILNSDETTSGLEVPDDIIVCTDAILEIPNTCTIKLPAGKKIIVEPGGKIEVSTGASVTFTSQTGEWGGIEFQGDSYGTLRNCTFQNTSTPIVIEGDPFGSADPPDIIIDSCNFNAPIEITNRKDVTVEYCNFNYSSGSVPSVLGISSSGSDNALFSNNIINSGSSISSTGMSVVYGSGIVIQKNAVNNLAVGISVSNTSPLVSQNRITNGTSSSAIVGIGFDNSYSAAVKQNSVIGYQIGYKLYNSSPEMYLDSSYNTGTSGDSVNGLHAVYLSNPRLKPGESIGGIIWDAGKNNLKTINKGSGIYMYMNSIPILDYGYNFIWGYDNYLFGDGPEVSEYYARCNNWVDDPPVSSEFNLSLPGSVVYSPYGCTPPGGSGFPSNKTGNDPEDDIKDSENPPAFIVVNYGHGIYDTIKVTTGTNDIPVDQNIFGEAVNEELTGNFLTAITKYKNLLSNYQTSVLASNSLKKILNCYVKMNADSNQYSDLRNYYLSLVQQYPGDTAFVKTAKELAVKTWVKKGEFANAITEYENLISGNNDLHEVLCCELNIIETYMIISEQGDAPGFTGNIASLKPLSKKDGYRKIMEKLYGVRSTQNNPVIPVHFSLSQNYPNPFNPLTKINYSLPNATKVHIQVYDLLGRLVKTLVNEFKEAGSYDVQFDGTGLASGVYFYRIEAGDFVDSKKMVLVK